MISPQQQSVAEVTTVEFTRNFGPKNGVIRFKIPVAKEARQSPPISKIGLTSSEIRFGRIALERGIPEAKSGQQTPVTGKIVLKLKLVSNHFRFDRPISGLTGKGLSRREAEII